MIIQRLRGVAPRSGGQSGEAAAPADLHHPDGGDHLRSRADRARPSEAVGGHIEGLDGIRAVAVVAVVAFHLWPQALPGGFIGVDVFFVISGFLITTLLLRERSRNGRVDLRGFWVRRARRLLPALLLVVTTSIVAAWMVDRDLLVGIGRQTVGALTFSSNWLEIRAGEDYFAETAPSLFLTFWSLAVEEQFYVFWPLAFLGILAVARTTTSRVAVALGIAGASALAMAVLYSPESASRVYYGTDTHLFGLLIGVALAFGFHGDGALFSHPRWAEVRRWLGFASLAGLVVLVFWLDGASSATYRGGLLLASILSAGMVASLPGEATEFTAVNRHRLLEWIGHRSYGIYLWHWPVILIVTAALPATAPGAPPSPVAVAISLALTLVLAAASYRFVEVPVRQHGFGLVWAVTGRPAVAGASLVVFALVAGALISAPEKSGAELAVERGQEMIAAQAAQAAPATSSPSATTSAPTPPEAVEGATPAWPRELAVPPGELISGFGDSVLSGAAPAMFERFPGIALDATPNRQWPAAPALVRAALDAGTLRPVVVLNFGTNAGLNSDASRDALREVLELVGPERRVVFVNTVGVSSWVPDANAKLAEIVAEHPNAAVVDWHAVVAARPELLHSDRTHPNMEGIAVYAESVATTLEALGPG